MNTLTIVPAEVAAAVEISRIGVQTYREHFADIWSSAGLALYLRTQFDVDHIAAEISTGQSIYLLARIPAPESPPRPGTMPLRNVGYCKLNPNATNPITGAPGLELEKIYLSAEATGSGIGSALLKAVFNLAVTTDQPSVWLDVLKSNAAGRRMYERNGFTVIGELPFATDVQEIGFWVMSSTATQLSEPTARS